MAALSHIPQCMLPLLLRLQRGVPGQITPFSLQSCRNTRWGLCLAVLLSAGFAVP